VAKDVLDSDVTFQHRSVYELEGLNQTFDLVFVGDLIEHLKNPLEALEQIRRVTRGRCVLSLGALILPRDSWLRRQRMRLARTVVERLGINSKFLTKRGLRNEQIVTYHGHEGGGSFFHFSVGAFRHALMASGFKKVEVHSTFATSAGARGVFVPQAVFHCEV
jgi:hypothetical protein